MKDRVIYWDVCADCGIGVRLRTGERCWAHADAEDVAAALKQFSEDGKLDARGVRLTAALLRRILDSAPHDNDGRTLLIEGQFEQAIFEDEANFVGVTFKGVARFDGATFEGVAQFEGNWFRDADVWFDGAIFQHDARFHGVGFRSAYFGGVRFRGDAWFEDAWFRRGAWFFGTTFQGDAWFNRVRFHRRAQFRRATVQGAAVFASSLFKGYAGFGEASFDGAVWFTESVFLRDAGFDGATFRRAQDLGPMLVRRGLTLDGAVFHERADIEIHALACYCRRTRFLAGVQLRVRWAQVVLDDADLANPSILTGVAPIRWPLDTIEERLARGWQRRQGTDTCNGRPRLISVLRADVTGLTVAGVDLRACRFAGAHHLDQLRIEECDIAYTPKGWRWTTRQTIAEEHQWRAAKPRPDPTSTLSGHHAVPAATGPSAAARRTGWYRPANQPPAWLKGAHFSTGLEVKAFTSTLEGEPLTPTQIAALYRALRKGREDNNDGPGAADFYYGEMEMRRHAKRAQLRWERRKDQRGAGTAAASEYAVLWLYWLMSGYGLRAWRALASLVVVVLLASVIFAFWGFAPPDQPSIRPVAVDARGDPIYARQRVERPAGLDELSTAIRFSAQGATALLRGPDRPLTALGEWLHMALRLVGPVLLGLAVLSIRGRIKR